MTGVAISIGDADLRRARRAMAELMRRGRDLKPAMEEIGSYLVSETLHRFETETRPEGGPWVPSVRAATEGGQTLTDRAHLRQSITYVAGADSVQVGSNLVYAAIHQFGGRAGRGRSVALPARPYLGLAPGDDAEIAAILDDYLSEPLT